MFYTNYRLRAILRIHNGSHRQHRKITNTRNTPSAVFIIVGRASRRITRKRLIYMKNPPHKETHTHHTSSQRCCATE